MNQGLQRLAELSRRHREEELSSLAFTQSWLALCRDVAEDGCGDLVPGHLYGAYQLISLQEERSGRALFRAKRRTSIPELADGVDVGLHATPLRWQGPTAAARSFVERLVLLQSCRHPSITGQPYEVFYDGRRWAYTEPWVLGVPLPAQIAQETGPIPTHHALPALRPVFDAVASLHAVGVVHGGLSAQSVVRTADGHLKLLWEAWPSSDERRTRVGLVDDDLGTVANDIFGLGLLLYEVLAGRLPWDPSEGDEAIQMRAARAMFPPPTKFYAEIPPRVVECVMACLSPSLRRRPPSVEAVLEHLLPPHVRSDDASHVVRKGDG